jgi:cyclopropane-fatty-acyl-phospholipid synthase
LAAHATDLLTRLFRGLDTAVPLRLWNGTLLTLGDACQAARAKGPHPFTLVCRRPAAVRAMALGRDPFCLAEVYFRDEVDIEGDFFAALGLKDHLRSISMSWRDRFGAAVAALALCLGDRTARGRAAERASLHGRSVREHSKTENREAIAFHYEVSNDFYALWLDAAMVYSCAYFDQPGETLEQAQQAKLDHVCRKLMLRPGDRLLDLGCGWGALAIHAAKHFGAHAHGITLSQRQLLLAEQRIAQAGLQDRVTVELRDYRDMPAEAQYDKVSSVDMFEHIGLKNLPVYFAKVHQLLKPGGLFLNHGITHDVEGWEKTLSSEFINRYVFPDGQLDTVSNIQRGMERAHFEIADVESLRPHYALTLRHRVMRLEAHHEQALQYVSESTWRVWRLYMATCAREFESGEIGVYQVLASKRAGGAALLPLTRRHQCPTTEAGSVRALEGR